MVSEYEMLLRLVVAMVCGSLLGIEREITGHSAGLRTMTLVCMGAALIILTDIYVHTTFKTQDSFRMAAQVVTGVGFIGAGTIFQTRSMVKGLTTAATIWISAAIGLAIGAGSYIIGVGVTILALIMLLLEPLGRHLPTIKQKEKDDLEK